MSGDRHKWHIEILPSWFAWEESEDYPIHVIRCVSSVICSEKVDLDLFGNIEQQVHRVLALLERDFPVSMQVIVFHLLHHLPMFLKRFGPLYAFWYERFNSWIIRRVLNRRYPEATVVETYRLTEWASFMALSGQIVEEAISSAETEEVVCIPSTTVDLSIDMVEDLRKHYFKSLLHLLSSTRRRSSMQRCNIGSRNFQRLLSGYQRVVIFHHIKQMSCVVVPHVVL